MTKRSMKTGTEPVVNHESKYVVSWWTRHPETGVPVVNEVEYDDIRRARFAFKDLPEASEPSAVRVDWSESTRSWVRHDLVGLARTPEEARGDRRRGIEMLRAVSAHKRGLDSRGSKVPGEPLDVASMLALGQGIDPRGHDHSKGAENCPICARRWREDIESECAVCDYLCEHGRVPAHPFAQLVQGTLGEQLDEERF
jgi:hypothetical protein